MNILYFSPADGECRDTVWNFFPTFPPLFDSQVRTIELIPSHPSRRSGLIVLLGVPSLSLPIDKTTLPSVSSSILSQLDENRTFILLLFLMLSKKQFKKSDRGSQYFMPLGVSLLVNGVMFVLPKVDVILGTLCLDMSLHSTSH